MGERVRCAVELTLAVAFGIADLLLSVLGVGPLQAALSVVQPEDPAPEPLPAAIRSLARATEALASYLHTSGDPDETRQLALGAAGEATTMLEEYEDLASDLGVNALVDQIHSSVVDLIGGTGMDRAAALLALQEKTGRASW